MIRLVSPPLRFISDLHLAASADERDERLVALINDLNGGELYLLGDWFDFWLGDDMCEAQLLRLAPALKAARERGVTIACLHGNHDFLLGARLLSACGVELLPDPTLLCANGKTLLITHGDLLCTADTGYLALRRQVRDADWQAQFLAKAPSLRLAEAQQLANLSEKEMAHKSAAMMDATEDGVVAIVETAMADNPTASTPNLIIHGHTHLPARHHHDIAGHALERWVLADWFRLPQAGDDFAPFQCLVWDGNTLQNQLRLTSDPDPRR